LKKETMFLSGNEALSLGAWEAGLKAACAYPGTPSSEILETLAGYKEIDSQWSVNEKVAFEVALGAAIGGVRSLYACKHVGLNVAMDPLMTAAYTGINAGFVVVVADDPGMHSSQNEQDTRWVGIYAKLPVLEPSGPAEAYSFVKEAFELSETFDTPVLVRLTTRVSHTKESIEVSRERKEYSRPFEIESSKYVMIPKNAYERHIFVEDRMNRLKAFAEKTPLNVIEEGKGKTGFITAGVAYNYVKEIFPDAPLLKLGVCYPFCDQKIKAFASGLEKVFVIEELDPFMENHVKTLGIKTEAFDPGYRIGELRPELIKPLVEGKKKDLNRPKVRKPVLCPGCPHRFVFDLLKKQKITVSGDIGCYTLAATPPLSAMNTTICMGGGITIQEGLQKAGSGKKIAGVVGDSTFIHSGITGLINAVYNRAKGVLLILDNSTTAMTGGQNHPGTGFTIKNEPTKKLDLKAVCEACGPDHVDVIDPYKYDELSALLKKRTEEDALSVIIAVSPCKLVDRSRGPVPLYKKDVCRKCGVCLKIDCPALTSDQDGWISINPDTCTGCGLCVRVCPFGALVKGADNV
jgi:indolepyruvate ferredoxin oxidoreductase alpha subunit